MDARKQLHVKRLRERLAEMDEIAKLNVHHPDFHTWKDRLKQSLGEVFGKDHDYTRRFSWLRFWHERASFDTGPGWSIEDQVLFEEGLRKAQQLLRDALEEFETAPPEPAPG